MNILKIALAVTLLSSAPALSQEKIDLEVIGKIRAEGMNNSKVMETLSHLTEEIGPRLTGSPQMIEANNWTADKLREWGLTDVKLDPFEFGPGWTVNHTRVHLISPRSEQLTATAIAWHPSTDGALTGELIYAPMSSKADFAKWKGKLKGKIVLVDTSRKDPQPSNDVFKRYSDKELADIADYTIPQANGMDSQMGWVNYRSFFFEREKFLSSEGAIAMVKRSSKLGMKLDGSSYQHLEDHLPKIPGVSVANEHYDRVVRLMNRGKDVKLSLDVSANYHADDMNSYNTIGEIKGKGRNPEIVLAGAHLDSWFLGTGAVDNGAGVAVVMEAVRILKAIGVEPKRTIRVGLWSGEEQGYYGSTDYVLDNLVSSPENTDPVLQYMAPYEKHYDMHPITKKNDYERFSAYFNIDNGGGKLRGIYAEGNAAAAAVFKEWLEPLHHLGATTVTLNSTGGTDHEPFDDVGLPGFQFIQDPLDYSSRLHHTQLDVLDNVYEDDLKQASVVLATFLYNAAMRDKRMPRKPIVK